MIKGNNSPMWTLNLTATDLDHKYSVTIVSYTSVSSLRCKNTTKPQQKECNRKQNKFPKISLLMLGEKSYVVDDTTNELVHQGRIQDFWKMGFMYIKVCGVSFADFISFFLNIP